MVRVVMLFWVLFFCSNVSFARIDTVFSPVSYTGIVLDTASQPVSAAIVSLFKHPYLTATTDAAGAFTITGNRKDTITVGVITLKTAASATGHTINMIGNNLLIASSLSGEATLELYSAAGRRIAIATINNVENGVRKIALPVSAEGCYLLKVSAGGRVAAFKRIFSAEQELTIKKTSAFRLGHSLTTAKTMATVADSLVAMASGYLPSYLAVTADTLTSASLTFTTSVNPWQPAAGEQEFLSGMVKIKANGRSFAMGHPTKLYDDDKKWWIEQPVNKVSFTYDYWMDTTLITQGLFDSLMKELPGYSKPQGWNSTYGVGINVAAHHSNLANAILFCNARSKASGLDTVYSYDSISGTPGGAGSCNIELYKTDCSKNGFRLPTEAEWEYACRGGSFTDFYWNKNYAPYPATAADTAEISDYALWYHNCGNLATTSPGYASKPGVASKKPNNYRLYDMVGSCWEWTHQVTKSYSAEGATDPKPSLTDTLIIQRGGNFSNGPVYLRSACRHKRAGDYHFCFFGFRTVREVRE